MLDNLDLALDQYEEMLISGDPLLDDIWDDDDCFDKECTHCGEKSLKWRLVDNKWRLYDQASNIHICDEFIKQKKTQDPENKKLARHSLEAYTYDDGDSLPF